MTSEPHIVLLCATARGFECLKTIRELQSRARLTVVSFREENWEPPFVDSLRAYCDQNDCTFFEMRRIDRSILVKEWRVEAPTLLLAVCWRYLIPREVFSIPRLGSFLFHDSLLPKYRGFSPTVWAILKGERFTGATLLRMAEEMDAGEILDQIQVPINENETIKEVMNNVTSAYVSMIRNNLSKLLSGSLMGYQQDNTEATFCCKRLPSDNRISWHRSTEEIHNLIRATTRPYPGAFTFHGDNMIRVWSSKKVKLGKYAGAIPGRIVGSESGVGVTVLTGDGAIMICDVEAESGGIVNASSILNSLSITLE